MKVQAQVSINGSREAIWSVLTDIDHAKDNITGIDEVEVLERPPNGLIGLKWKETRTLMGKPSSEVMWIIEAVENEYYKARAESNGCIFTSEMRVDGEDPNCTLTMNHHSAPQTLGARLMMAPMGLFFKGMFRKLILQDLNDIKGIVEGKPNTAANQTASGE